jgi:hypothetical protein
LTFWFPLSIFEIIAFIYSVSAYGS